MDLFQNALPLLSPSIKLSSIFLACEEQDKMILESIWKRKFRFSYIRPTASSAAISTIVCEAASVVLSNADLLRTILSNIDASQLASLRVVSHRWNRVIGTVPALLHNFGLPVDQSLIATSFPKLRGLTILQSIFGKQSLDLSLITALTNLKSLNLSNIQLPQLNYFARCFTGLQSLATIYFHVSHPTHDGVFSSYLRQLTRLDCVLNVPFGLGGGGSAPLQPFDFGCFSSLVNLVSLKFESLYSQRGHRNVEVLSTLRHLKHLSLSSQAHLLSSSPNPLLARLTNLRSVTLAVPVPGVRLPFLHTLHATSSIPADLVMPSLPPLHHRTEVLPLFAEDFPALAELLLEAASYSLNELQHLTKLTIDFPHVQNLVCPSFSKLQVLVITMRGFNENLLSGLPVLPALHTLDLFAIGTLSSKWSSISPNLTSLAFQSLAEPEWSLSVWATSLQSLSCGTYRTMVATGSTGFAGFGSSSIGIRHESWYDSFTWLKPLSSLHTLKIESPLALQNTSEWATALVKLRDLTCSRVSLTPAHIPPLKLLPELRTLRVNAFEARMELAKNAREHIPQVLLRCIMEIPLP